METLKDTFRYLIGGYYGVLELDSYELKEYVLKDIENYIIAFIEKNKIIDFNYQEEAEKVKEQLDFKTKLQDSLLVLYKIDAPMDLIWMIKQKLKEWK